jgi:hypothetical protein
MTTGSYVFGLACVLAFALLANWEGIGQAFRLRRETLPVPKIDLAAPCPACGHCQNTVKFDLKERCLRRTCSICEAQWGESTIIDPTRWNAGPAEANQ